MNAFTKRRIEGSQVSWVSTVIRLWVKKLGSEIPISTDHLPSLPRSNGILGLTSSSSMCTGVKSAELRNEHSPPSSAKFKKPWSFNTTFQCVFMTCCLSNTGIHARSRTRAQNHRSTNSHAFKLWGKARRNHDSSTFTLQGQRCGEDVTSSICHC